MLNVIWYHFCELLFCWQVNLPQNRSRNGTPFSAPIAHLKPNYMSRIFILISFTVLNLNLIANDLNLVFKITADTTKLGILPENGRIFLVFNKEKSNSLINGINQYPDIKANSVFGIDINNWDGYFSLILEGGFYGFPIKSIDNLSHGKWYIKVIYDIENISPYINEPGNYYSDDVLIEIKNNTETQTIELELNNQIETKEIVPDKEYIRFIKFKSDILSEFWKQPINLHAQVILPKSYFTDPVTRYPVLYLIGGIGYRYYKNVVKEKEWFSENVPQMIIVFLDSKAPFGDSYQVNSENNGPYGDANIYELIPYIEKEFRCIGKPYARFLTGTSTGGWASLALQIFYPDFFNGAWSTCSDPVDFHQMELVNIYKDENAFINRYKVERPAMRNNNGEPRYTMRTEIQAENTLGPGNTYITSGLNWGSWNAVYSPKDNTTGLPMAIFDPHTGIINKNVADAWKKYDLRYYLNENWDTIGNKLQGKLHIWMGTKDSYYLDNAMRLFDDFIKKTSNPKSDAKIVFECGEGHDCGPNLYEMMEQMIERM
jgi:enterochelin esterase-like enzyme